MNNIVVLSVRRTGKYCGHANVVVDQYERRVECATCAAPLDPFDCLLSMAHPEDNYVARLKQLEEDCTAAQARLDDLRRQETNARARKKRLVVPPLKAVSSTEGA